MKKFSLVVVCFFLLSFSYSSQTLAAVRHVGPGQKYAEIADAVAVSTNDDLIWVHQRSYAYQPFSIYAQSISILGFNGKFQVDQTNKKPAINIGLILPGQSVTIYDAEINFQYPTSPAIVIDNVFPGGAVRFKNTHLQLDHNMPQASVPGPIMIKDADTVWFDGLLAHARVSASVAKVETAPIQGNDAMSVVHVTNSNLILQNSEIWAFGNDPNVASGHNGGDGVRLIDSRLTLYGGYFRGGTLGNFGGHAIHRVERNKKLAQAEYNCSQAFYAGGWGVQREGLGFAINGWGRKPLSGGGWADPFIPNCTRPGFTAVSVDKNPAKINDLVQQRVWSIETARQFVMYAGYTRFTPALGTGSFDGRLMIDFLRPVYPIFQGITVNKANGSDLTGSMVVPNDLALVGQQLTLQGVFAPPLSQIPSPNMVFSIPQMWVITD